MRFLIAFLVFSCFMFSAASAKEKKTSDSKKLTIKSSTSFRYTIYKKGKRALSLDDEVERIDFIQHVTEHHSVFTFLIVSSNILVVNELTDQTQKVYVSRTPFNYQIILDCLYPTHSFW